MSSSNPQTLKSTTLAMVFSKYRSCCWNPTWLGCWLFVDHHLFGGKNKAIFTMKFGGSVISSHSKHPHIWLVKHLGPPTLGYTMGRFLPDLSPTLHAIRKDSRPGQITLLRVIPTLAFQVIYSDIYFDIAPNILSDIYSDILSGISSSILSGIYFSVLSGIYSGILCGILSRVYFGILCGILCGIYSGSLSGIYAGSLSGIYSGIPSGRWGPAVPTELGRSQVEVQRCPLGSEGPWLTSSGAHCAQNLAVEVQQCPLRSEAGSWGPVVPTARGSWRRDWRRVGKAEVDVEGEAEVVEEKEEEQEEEDKKEEEENNCDKI